MISNASHTAVIPFGPLKGTPLNRLPLDYLRTAARTFSDPDARRLYPQLAMDLERELGRRMGVRMEVAR